VKTPACLLPVLALAVLAACGDDPSNAPAPAPVDGLPMDEGETPSETEPLAPPVEAVPTPTEGEGQGPIDKPEPDPWYSCQGSDRAFVRRAILGVLGRRPLGQAEVDVYTDLMREVEQLGSVSEPAAEGTAAEGTVDSVRLPPSGPPGSPLSRPRQVLLQALFATQEYRSNWLDLYRDFLRVHRVDEISNPECYGTAIHPNPREVAVRAREQAAFSSGDGNPFSMQDVIVGSLEIDDMSPIYIANMLAMMVRTYVGANAEMVSLELTRRDDFGAWFDDVYLNRNSVCLGCHNTEFSVTQSNDPATNRHYPVPYLLEKSLFGASTGPATYGGFEGGDRLHAPLKFARFVSHCAELDEDQLEELEELEDPPELPECAAGEPLIRCSTASDGGLPIDFMCDSTYQIERNNRPWGWADTCGSFMAPDLVPIDMGAVEAKFGDVVGLRSSVWGLVDSLQSGFMKLRREGLGALANGEVPDADKAFAYLVSMNVVEKVWREIAGTPLTIPNHFPRNAAARDQLQLLTETFMASGYSNEKLIEAILASPYLNLPAPDAGCGPAAYAVPRIFDPWVTAEEDPLKRENGPGDGVASLSARSATRAAYAALGWPLVPYAGDFPIFEEDNDEENPQTPEEIADNLVKAAEYQFQSEVGIFLKNSEPGFRGFDFQALLGWQDRFGRCAKLDSNQSPDAIDELLGLPGEHSVGDAVAVLKDRIMGEPLGADAEERALLESVLGASLEDPLTTLEDADTALRRVCGAFISTPQFMLMGVAAPDAAQSPQLTLPSASYASVCIRLAASSLPGGLSVSCGAGNDEVTQGAGTLRVFQRSR
jgi:hypothetical protein